MNKPEVRPADKERVLTAAVLKAAGELGMSNDELSAVINVPEAALNQGAILKLNSSEYEAASLLVRLYASLSNIVGSDSAYLQGWLYSHNDRFAAKPIDYIRRSNGLLKIVSYLESVVAQA